MRETAEELRTCYERLSAKRPTMTAADLEKMRKGAESWLGGQGRTISRVTRETALGEEHMALDVLDLIAEVERLRAALHEACDIGERFIEDTHRSYEAMPWPDTVVARFAELRKVYDQ